MQSTNHRPRTTTCTLLAASACLLLLAGAQGQAEARARVGQPAPWFKLEDLRGRSFASARLRGKPAVLVVGRTQKAAPPCKQWVLELIRRYGRALPVYQVIVVDKSWFIPRSLVISKIEGFIPRRLRHRVLLEWYTVFADTWGVPLHDEPTVMILGSDGVLRHKHRGAMTKRALKRVERTLDEVALAAR